MRLGLSMCSCADDKCHIAGIVTVHSIRSNTLCNAVLEAGPVNALHILLVKRHISI